MNICHKYRIVLLDDDKYTNQLHALVILSTNLAKTILCTDDSEKALQEIREMGEKYEFPDIVFIDAGMPEMDIHSFGERINRLENFDPNKTRIVYLIDGNAKKEIQELNGALHCYEKPLDKEVLRQVVKDVYNIEPNF